MPTNNPTGYELRAQAAALLRQAAALETPIRLDDLDDMTPAEIVAARKAGRLDHLMNPTTTEGI